LRIVQVEIKNFRGIKSMPPWNPSAGVNCLIGPGDSTKTTILDAIELCLYPRAYFLADDSDFFNLDVEEPIRIIVTLTDLPVGFTALDRYGHFLRGWNEKKKQIEDEPKKGEDEPSENPNYALSIAVEIDKSLEGRWSIFNERIASSGGDPPNIRYKDVEQLATSRLGRYADRHLGWGRNSILARIANNGGKFTAQLADARRAAKTAFQKGDQTAFEETAKKAENLSKTFAVPVQKGYSVMQRPRTRWTWTQSASRSSMSSPRRRKPSWHRSWQRRSRRQRPEKRLEVRKQFGGLLRQTSILCAPVFPP